MLEEGMDGLDYFAYILRTHSLALFCIIVVSFLYATMLAAGAPGFGHMTWQQVLAEHEWYANIPIVLIVYMLGWLLTLGVIAGEVLVFSATASITSSIVSQRAVRISVQLLLLVLAYLLYCQVNGVLTGALASAFASGNIRNPNDSMITSAINALNILLVISGMMVPLPKHMVKDMVGYKVAAAFMIGETRHVAGLLEAQTKFDVQIIQMGGQPQLPAVLAWIFQEFIPTWKEVPYDTRQVLLGARPDLYPVSSDLVVGSGNRYGVGVDQYGRGYHSHQPMPVTPGTWISAPQTPARQIIEPEHPAEQVDTARRPVIVMGREVKKD